MGQRTESEVNMNKSVLATAVWAACLSAGLALPALAAEPQTQSPGTQPATSAQVGAEPATKSKPRAVPAPGTRQCLRSTGSLIPPPKGQCLPVAGTSYSQQDIQRTGELDMGRALQMLDPSIQVRGH